jgi:osmotically-inducible protein OsmY
MNSPMKMRITLVALSLMLTAGAMRPATALQKPAKMDCATATAADIAKAINDKIPAKYAAQKKHINVSVKDGVVNLRGWVTTNSAKKEIEKLAKGTACVKRVQNWLGVGVKTGCGPGMQKCGDICIPADETCNILMN